MTSNKPEASDWVKRLAKALDVLARSVTANDVSNEEYRLFAELAKSDPKLQTTFAESFPKLNADPAPAIAILQSHPRLQRGPEYFPSEPADEIPMPPGPKSELSLDMLAAQLAKTAVQKGGRYAAERLELFLQLSEEKTLPGYEITLFHGLKVEKRFELSGLDSLIDNAPHLCRKINEQGEPQVYRLGGAA